MWYMSTHVASSDLIRSRLIPIGNLWHLFLLFYSSHRMISGEKASGPEKSGKWRSWTGARPSFSQINRNFGSSSLTYAAEARRSRRSTWRLVSSVGPKGRASSACCQDSHDTISLTIGLTMMGSRWTWKSFLRTSQPSHSRKKWKRKRWRHSPSRALCMFFLTVFKLSMKRRMSLKLRCTGRGIHRCEIK